MQLVFSKPLFLKHIFIQCDPTTRKAVLCLSHIWRGVKDLIQQSNIAANGIHQISLHLNIPIQRNFEACENNEEIFTLIKGVHRYLKANLPNQSKRMYEIWRATWSSSDSFHPSLKQAILGLEPSYNITVNACKRDDYIRTYCWRLIKAYYLNSALETCLEIDNQNLKNAFMSKIANKNFKIGFTDVALSITRTIPDLQIKAIGLVDYSPRPITAEIYEQVKEIIVMTENPDDKDEIYSLLRDALDSKTQKKWIKEIDKIYDPDCFKDNESAEKYQRILTKAQQWIETGETDVAEALEIYQNLFKQDAVGFGLDVVSRLFMTAQGDRAITWGMMVDKERIDEVLTISINFLIEQGKEAWAIRCANLLSKPWSISCLNKITEKMNSKPNIIHKQPQTFDEMLDLAMELEYGEDRDTAFEQICYLLICEKNFRMAFEYSDNIENLETQHRVRKDIQQKSMRDNPLFSKQMMQKQLGMMT